VNSGVGTSVSTFLKSLNAYGTRASFYHQNIGSCVPINKFANIPLYSAACCPEKLTAIQAAKNDLKTFNDAKPADFRMSELGLKQQIVPARDSESPNLLIRKPASRLDAGTQVEKML
jgi:hypothetical protein